MKKIYFLLYFLFVSTVCSAQWTAATTLGNNDNIYDIYYANSQFVAVGAFGLIKTSPDGDTWTKRTSGTTTALFSTCYANGIYVTVGGAGTIKTSTNGSAWASATSNTTNLLRGLTYDGTKFVAVGGNNPTISTIITSPDGTTAWSVIPSSSIEHELTGIIYANGKFVATGRGGTILTSTNGTTWNTQTSNTSADLWSVTYGNGKYVITGYQVTLTSTDGLTWEAQEFTTPEPLYSLLNKVIYAEGLFVTVGNPQLGTNMVRTSPDGITWTNKNVTGGSDLSGVAYGNGTFVVGGDGGSVYYSSAAALPVTLVSFKGESKGNTAHLSWETTAEVNTNYFQIERSRDAQSFEAIGKVQAIGNSTTRQVYGFTDETPFIGTNYYRLKEVDKDGTSQEFRPVSVVIQGDDVAFGVYPNPVQAQEFTVKVEDADQAQLELRSVQGNRINFNTNKVGDYQVVIQPTQTLAKGMYLLSVKTIGSSRVHKVVFQ